jgi:hypothetical protein
MSQAADGRPALGALDVNALPPPPLSSGTPLPPCATDATGPAAAPVADAQAPPKRRKRASGPSAISIDRARFLDKILLTGSLMSDFQFIALSSEVTPLAPTLYSNVLAPFFSEDFCCKGDTAFFATVTRTLSELE